MSNRVPDLVTVDVIGYHLLAIAREMGTILIRSSYSSNIKERQDCSASLLDATGLTIAQAEHIPLHMGSMLGIVEHVLETFGADGVNPGDVFIANDPYSGGGTHLPDITVATPFFYKGTLRAFLTNVAHHAEVGGTLQGANDVYSEGLRIPPVKVYEGGNLRQDVLEFILLNFRLREERLGDLRAQFAATRTGEERMKELYDKYGAETIRASIDILMEKADQQIRSSIEKIPDDTYCFVDWMDIDGGGRDEIRVCVTVKGDRMICDFTGSAAQSPGNYNVVISALRASVLYAIRALLDPTIPANAGYYDAIEIIAPPGTIVNANSPAAINTRSDTCQRVVDAIFGALFQAIPDRVVAAGNGAVTGIYFNGHDPFRKRFFSYVETLGGGSGARPTKDGLDAVHVHVTNTSNLPVEALEMEYPLLVQGYELVPDSGGPGQYRGGLALRRRIEILADNIYYSSKGDRTVTPPWGLAGGRPGGKSKFVLVRRAEDGTDATKTLGARVQGLVLKAGDQIEVTTAGSGGYGDPRKRKAEFIEKDLQESKVSRASAEDAYEYKVS